MDINIDFQCVPSAQIGAANSEKSSLYSLLEAEMAWLWSKRQKKDLALK